MRLVFFLLLSFFSLNIQARDFFWDVLPDNEVLIPFPNNHIGKDLDPNNIDLLVWNIYKAQKKNIYTDLLYLSENKSLVLLQEGVATKDFQNFSNYSNKLFWLMAGSFRDNSNIVTGVVSGFQSLPLNSFFIRSPTYEPITNTPKMILGNIFKLADQKLLVLNIHGINFVTTDSFKKQILAAITVLQKHSGPVIFAGDFNTWNSERMSFLNKEMAKLNIKHIQQINYLRQTLDHIYIRGLDVLSYKSLDNIQSSDHSPLIAKLKLGKSNK